MQSYTITLTEDGTGVNTVDFEAENAVKAVFLAGAHFMANGVSQPMAQLFGLEYTIADILKYLESENVHFDFTTN